jgi:hypothetical protein
VIDLPAPNLPFKLVQLGIMFSLWHNSPQSVTALDHLLKAL